MPRRQRFETLSDARTRNRARVEILGETAGPRSPRRSTSATRPRLATCRPAPGARVDIGSTSPARRSPSPQAYVGPHEFATIFLDAVGAGSLPDASLEQAHAALRTRLNRSGFRGSVACRRDGGGVDRRRSALDSAPPHPSDRRPPRFLGAASSELSDFGDAVPLKVEALNDDARQLSYLTKFTTYHRPLKRGPGRPSPAFPLPPARLRGAGDVVGGLSLRGFRLPLRRSTTGRSHCP